MRWHCGRCKKGVLTLKKIKVHYLQIKIVSGPMPVCRRLELCLDCAAKFAEAITAPEMCKFLLDCEPS